MNEHTTTTPTTAHARELARELREHDDKAMPAPWFLDDTANSRFIVYARSHAAHIATTLDALADECERLREENATSNNLLDLGKHIQTLSNITAAELLTMLQNPATVHMNILRGVIALTRMQALHIACATDYDTIKVECETLRQAATNNNILPV